jgi:hypothetical protein
VSLAVDMMLNQGYNPTPPADINNDGIVNDVDVALLVQLILQN